MKMIIHNKQRLLTLFALTCFLVFSSGCAGFKKDEIDTEPLSAEVLYGAAKEALLQEQWSEAVDKLKTLEARYPYGRFAKQAQLDTAFAEYKLGRDSLAIIAADRFILLNPTHPTIDYAYYIKGLASFNEVPGFRGVLTGRTNLSERDPQSVRDALQAFTTIVQRYPNSPYAHDSGKRIVYLNSATAKHEINIARFYYNRSAYVASANRAKSVLENYTDLPEVEDALGIMYLSYEQMDMLDLAADTIRVLALNYPDSRFLKYSATGKSKKRLFSRLFN